jgi:hypothetical protein
MKKIIAFLIFIPIISFGQWTLEESNDPFDGKIIYVTAKGYGGDFPYANPSLIIRYKKASEKIDVYISGLGYTGCDDNSLIISYNNDPGNVKRYSVSESVGNDALFINDYQFKDLFDNLKKYSVISVKFRNSCRINTFSFGLKGSSLAINRLLNQTKQFNPKLERLQAEREKKQRIIDNKKNLVVNETFYRLIDSMKQQSVPENTIKLVESSLIRKIKAQYDINPDLSEFQTIVIKPTLTKGEYFAFLKYKSRDDENLWVTFNKKSDELIFKIRYEKFINDLKYLKVTNTSIEKIDKIIKYESRNIYEETTYDAIIASDKNKITGNSDFEKLGKISLYFKNSKDKDIKKLRILGEHYVETKSPLYESLNKELQHLQILMGSLVNKLNREELLNIKSSIYRENLHVFDIKEINFSKKKNEINKQMFKKGFRKLVLILNDDRKIIISNLIDTKNNILHF